MRGISQVEDKSVQLVPTLRRERTPSCRHRVNESIYEKANEFCKHHQFMRVNVPPYGDYLPQACLVVCHNYKHHLSTKEESKLLQLK